MENVGILLDEKYARDDGIFYATRCLSIIIVPIVLVSVGALYLFPDHTRELFAWTIKPRMSPMLLGAVYLAGAYFFIRAATSARWHWVKAGFLPIIIFATMMGIATILHWDRVNHSHVAFILWATIYFIAPFLVLGVWLRNRVRNTDAPDENDLFVPLAVRWGISSLGVLTAILSILLFLLPNVIISLWPWMLTPLTARVIGSLFALISAQYIGIALDARWSGIRIIIQTLLLALAAVALAIIFSWSNFQPANLFTWVFVGSTFLLLVATAVLYIYFEAQYQMNQGTRIIDSIRFIPTAVHSPLDYLGGIALIEAPLLFGFSDVGGLAVYVPILLGSVLILYSLFTKYELGILGLKYIPMSYHLLFDLILAVSLVASPFIFGFASRVWFPHVVVGIVILLLALVSQTHAKMLEA
ncbi:MAG: hypothetical protein NVS9B9_20720 [Ktedonobacteraceae bacterium]